MGSALYCLAAFDHRDTAPMLLQDQNDRLAMRSPMPLAKDRSALAVLRVPLVPTGPTPDLEQRRDGLCVTRILGG